MANILSRSRDARVVRTRANLEAALVALLADQRLDDISVADIAAHAGVSYSTFFRHFSDKQELWSGLSKSLIEQINRRIAPLIASENHRGVAQEICEFVAENRTLYCVLMTQGAVDHTREAMLRNARHLAGLQKAGWTSGFPVGLATEFAVHGIIAILSWWLKDGAAAEPEKVAEAMDQLIFGPLFEGAVIASLATQVRPFSRPGQSDGSPAEIPGSDDGSPSPADIS